VKHLRSILLSPDKQYDLDQDRALKYDIKTKFLDYEDIQKQAIKQVPVNEHAYKFELVSDPVEKRKNFGMTMPVKMDLLKKDPLSYVNTIGMPLYKKDSKKEFMDYCKSLEESLV
jgi:hypothetical protein